LVNTVVDNIDARCNHEDWKYMITVSDPKGEKLHNQKIHGL